MWREPNNQDAAQWILSDFWAQKLVHKRNVRSRLVFCPFLEAVAHEDNVVHAPAALGQVCLEARLSQVEAAGFINSFLVVVDSFNVSYCESLKWARPSSRPVELPQLHQSPCKWLGLMACKCSSQATSDFRNDVDLRLDEFWDETHLVDWAAR